MRKHLKQSRIYLTNIFETLELKQGATLFSVRFFTLTFGLVQSILAARWMTVSDFTATGAVSLIYGLAAGIGGGGIEFFVFGKISNNHTTWVRGIARRYLREVILLRGTVALLLPIGGMLWHFGSGRSDQNANLNVMFGALGVVTFCYGNSLVDVFRNIAQIRAQYALLARHYAIFECALRFLPIICYQKLGLSGYWTINGLVSLGAYLHLRQDFGILTNTRSIRGRLTVYRRCLWQAGIGVSRFAYLRGDEALCMSLAGNESFAAYMVAKRLAGLVQTVCDMLIAHSWGRVFHAGSNSLNEQIRRVKVFFSFIMLSVLPVCSIFALARAPLIHLYSGEKYPNAAPFVPWLAFATLTYFMAMPFMTLLQVRRRFFDVFWLSAMYSAVVLASSAAILQMGAITYLGAAQLVGSIAILIATYFVTKSEIS